MEDYVKFKFKLLSGTLIFLFITLFSSNSLLAVTPVKEQIGQESLFSLLVKGGPIMIPLLICSVLAVAFFIERLIALRKSNIAPESFFSKLTENIDGFSSEGLNAAEELCQEKPMPISNILRAGIRKCRTIGTLNVVEETLEDIASREVRKIKNSLNSLKIIASISPLLGLLGTVYGMITAFQAVASMSAGAGKAESLANGIFEAMVTTAAGLTIAIPVLLAYSYLNYVLNKHVNDIEQFCDRFMDDYLLTLTKHNRREGDKPNNDNYTSGLVKNEN